MNNFSKLLSTSTHNVTLESNLELTNAKRTDLLDARAKVRECLRNGLQKAVRDLTGVDVPKPRFFTQGSWTYKTLISPAHAPPQQIDLDDGVYLPLSRIENTGLPREAARAFFEAIETTLASLVLERHWKLISDKDTCVRLELGPDAHMDIPLYSIPDHEFVTLEARALKMDSRTVIAGVGGGEDEIEEQIWNDLPPDSVLLAHRKENWKKSDPRPFRRWFEQQKAIKGEQLTRTVRYLKAYRDWRWREGGPSSILLTVAISECFEKHHGRDDVALSLVADRLPDILSRGVDNPTESESLTDRFSPEEMMDILARMNELRDALQRACNADSSSEVVALLTSVFGPRCPNDTSRVELDRSPGALEREVTAHKAKQVPSPIVGRTRAG